MEGCLVLDLSVWEAEGSGQLRPGRFSPTCLKFGQAGQRPLPNPILHLHSSSPGAVAFISSLVPRGLSGE